MFGKRDGAPDSPTSNRARPRCSRWSDSLASPPGGSAHGTHERGDSSSLRTSSAPALEAASYSSSPADALRKTTAAPGQRDRRSAATSAPSTSGSRKSTMTTPLEPRGRPAPHELRQRPLRRRPGRRPAAGERRATRGRRHCPRRGARGSAVRGRHSATTKERVVGLPAVVHLDHQLGMITPRARRPARRAVVRPLR